MAHDQLEPSMFGPGAKLVGVMVIVVGAFAMGFSAGTRHTYGQVDERLDEMNEALYRNMTSRPEFTAERSQTTSTAQNEIASTADESAPVSDAGK